MMVSAINGKILSVITNALILAQNKEYKMKKHLLTVSALALAVMSGSALAANGVHPESHDRQPEQRETVPLQRGRLKRKYRNRSGDSL